MYCYFGGLLVNKVGEWLRAVVEVEVERVYRCVASTVPGTLTTTTTIGERLPPSILPLCVYWWSTLRVSCGGGGRAPGGL